MSFEELEHTADARFRIRAPTLPELYAEAVRALMTVMYGRPGEDGETREIEAEGHDPESLVHAFLSEVLFLSDVEGLVFSGASVTVGETRVRGTLSGEPYSPEKHGGGREVKGISFSGLSISRDDDSYTLDVIFDV
ncbi:MAG: archease [Methanolinea sp.]|nr:archease [Methanolinea sp.]